MSAISIELPPEVSERLDQLIERSGRSQADYVLEAITDRIEELEDLYVAEQRWRAQQQGASRSYTLDEVEQRLGLAN